MYVKTETTAHTRAIVMACARALTSSHVDASQSLLKPRDKNHLLCLSTKDGIHSLGAITMLCGLAIGTGPGSGARSFIGSS